MITHLQAIILELFLEFWGCSRAAGTAALRCAVLYCGAGVVPGCAGSTAGYPFGRPALVHLRVFRGDDLPACSTHAHRHPTPTPLTHTRQAICSDLGRVYEIGPVFRAENSYTHRHLCEFTGLDMEMAIAESYHEVLDVLDALFVHMFKVSRDGEGWGRRVGVVSGCG